VSSQFEIKAVGIVRSSRSEPEDDSWDKESSRIEMLTPFDKRSLLGLEIFSHCIKSAFLRSVQKIGRIDLVSLFAVLQK